MHLHSCYHLIKNLLSAGQISVKQKYEKSIVLANSEDPDQTLHYAMFDMGLHCLAMSHKKDTGLC